MIKKYINTAILLLLVGSNLIFGQHLSLFNVNQDNYPTVTADFYAFDYKGNQLLNTNKNHAEIKENGIDQEVIKVVNPKYKSPIPVSIVMSIDVSGSMENGNMEMAKNAATTIINSIPLDISECALTSFDHLNYINSDFTRNKSILQSAISSLKPQGATDYNEALTNPLTGALEVVKSGDHKKVIIFLTDGLGEADDAKIIAKAKATDAVIYCVMINMQAPEVLQRIATQSGGRFFENIQSKEDAKAVYQQILFEVEELKPSTITWKSNATCNYSKAVDFKLKDHSAIAPMEYYAVGIGKRALLTTEKRTVEFKNAKPDQKNEAEIILSAKNASFIIDKIDISNKRFKINESLPFEIKPGTKKALKVLYVSSNSDYQDGRITLYSSNCEPISVFVSNGILNSSTIPIRVNSPNGGETFYTNSDTIITWSGTLLNDPVKLEYSLDNGTIWTEITNSAEGFSHSWKTPKNTSKKVKIRASIEKETKSAGVSNTPIERGTKVFDYPCGSYSAKLTLDQKYLVIDNYRTISIIDAKTGGLVISKKFEKSLLSTLSLTSNEIYLTFLFDYNGTTGTYSRETFVYDIKTLTQKSKMPAIKATDYISNDYNTYVHSHDNIQDVIDIKTGKILYTLKAKGKPGTLIGDLMTLTQEDEKQHQIWNYKTGKLLHTVKTDLTRARKAIISDDQKYFITFAEGPNARALAKTEVYSYPTMQLQYVVKSNYNYGSTLDAHGRVLLCHYEGSGPSIIDLPTGKYIQSLGPKHTNGGVGKNGAYVFANKGDGFSTPQKVDVYRLNAPKVQLVTSKDESDVVFSIIEPKIDLKNQSFGEVLIGESKDKYIEGGISHNLVAPLRIKKISISGVDSNQFKLISTPGPLDLEPSGILNIEIRFSPTTARKVNASIVVETNYGKIDRTLSGIGVVPQFALKTRVLDLGKIKIGEKVSRTFPEVVSNDGAISIDVFQSKAQGPDIKQFKIEEKNLSLQPSKAGDILVKFEALKRGKTNTIVSYTTNSGQKASIQVFAEVIAPKNYRFNGSCYDKALNQLTSANIEIYDGDTLGSPYQSIQVNNSGIFSTNLHADRSYVIICKKVDFKTEVASIDLTKNIPSDEITKEFMLVRNNVANQGPMVIFKGIITDKNDNETLNGKITIKLKESSETIESQQEGYNTGIVSEVIGDTVEIIADVQGYLPVSKMVAIKKFDKVLEIEENFSLIHITSGETVQLENVLFEQSRPTLLPQSYSQLNMLVQFLLKNPDNKIELAGHTDNQGNAKLNVKLSEQRVETIKSYLIERGISEDRISGKGYGGKKPIASNAGEKTRRLNRRVEFVIK